MHPAAEELKAFREPEARWRAATERLEHVETDSTSQR